MARLLTFLMIFAIVTAHGMAMAAAVCRHDNVREHVLARQSQDMQVAAASLREEAAASATTKATGSGDPSSLWPAKMLPADSPAPPLRLAERLRLRPMPQPPLSSLTVSPLLEPPAA